MYPIDHIGLAVPNLDQALAEYKKNFSVEGVDREALHERGVELVFLNLPNTRIELLAPLAPTSAIQKFLDTKGPGLHHLCYLVKDINAELARFKSLGHQLIDERPRPGAKGSIIAFIHPKTLGGVLTELCQKVG